MLNLIPILACLLPQDPWTVVREDEIFVGVDFGESLCVEGDLLVVGRGSKSVSAYQRAGTSWSFVESINPEFANGSGNFGRRLDISGTLFVGSKPGSDLAGVDAGAAYVYAWNGTSWVQDAALFASDAQPGDLFGLAVAIDGDRIAASSGSPGPTGNLGSVYIFERSGYVWLEKAKVNAIAGTPNNSFGLSLCLDGDSLAVGAHRHLNSLGAQTGAVYIYERNLTQWLETALLQEPVLSTYNTFSESLDLSGDTVIVGASSDTGGRGAAYVLRDTGSAWIHEAKITPSNPQVSSFFGVSVALEDELAVVGWPAKDTGNGADAGAAQVWARTASGWDKQAGLSNAPGANAGALLGHSVYLRGDTIAVGAPAYFAPVVEGAAHLFRAFPSPSSYCTAGTSSNGCQATLLASGIPSANQPSGFVLSAAGMEGDKDGLFFFGTSGRQANSWGSGTSFQCVIPPVLRAGLLVGSGTPGACDGAVSQDLNALWCPTCPKPTKNPGPGALVQAQLWYRDPTNTSNQTTSLSDAMEFGVGP
jgi:hypothetical protein